MITEQSSEIGEYFSFGKWNNRRRKWLNKLEFHFAGDSLQKTDKNIDENSHNNNSISDEANDQEKLPTPIDWKPQENCYFCVDGKLLTVNDKGDLVAESGSVNTEPELANRVCSSHMHKHSNN